MESAEGPVVVVDNPDENRYEARIGGELAFLIYEREGNRINLIHTEVPQALAGHDIGAALARTALDAARAAGLTVIPNCPFVAAYIRRHPDYLDLVPPGWRHLLERRQDERR